MGPRSVLLGILSEHIRSSRSSSPSKFKVPPFPISSIHWHKFLCNRNPPNHWCWLPLVSVLLQLGSWRLSWYALLLVVVMSTGSGKECTLIISDSNLSLNFTIFFKSQSEISVRATQISSTQLLKPCLFILSIWRQGLICSQWILSRVHTLAQSPE